nr:inorganic pyrophosphatase [Cryptococcus tetragattii IND107]
MVLSPRHGRTPTSSTPKLAPTATTTLSTCARLVKLSATSAKSSRSRSSVSWPSSTKARPTGKCSLSMSTTRSLLD